MSWTCPNCNRTFFHTNQAHSCEVKPVEIHFEKSDPEIKEIYQLLLHHLSDIGNFRISSVKNAILISNRATFLAIKISKSYLTLEFFLDHEEQVFPVFKCVRIGKKRVVHFIKLQSSSEIDSQLIRWLKESYQLIMNNYN